MQSHSIGTNRTIGTNGRTESSCTQTEPYLNEMQFTNGVPMACQVILLVPIVPLVPMDERNPAILKQNHTQNSRSPLNDMQFTNGIPMECQVILLVPIVPLVPMDERNPILLKQNHTLMRCNSPMAYQWNAVILLVPIVPLVPMDERNPAILKQNHTQNSRSRLNDMQFTNGIPMECQVILLVPIVPLVPMDERNPTLLKQNHTLMRCNSPMEYQWNAKSLYWYQSYHWYQWTNGIQLYSNRTIPKIA